MENEYSINWFKKRALESIKPIAAGTWDFSSSLLLYVPQAEEAYEKIQKEETIYRELITKPEAEYISKISNQITTELPDNFYYIDLGPGTEHKERFFFDVMKGCGKKFAYFPVDISLRVLDAVRNFAQALGIKTSPILAPFEECDKYLPADGVYRFISLGLTFANYHIQDILQLLRKIIGVKGSAFINAHIRERVDMGKMRNSYIDQFECMITPKLELLNLRQENIDDIEVNDKVEIWCTIKKPTTELAKKGIGSGDRMLVFQSLRYSLDELIKEIPKVFPNYSMFDIGFPFVGFLLKK